MATGNFINTEHGIFVIPRLSYADALEILTDEGEPFEESDVRDLIDDYEASHVVNFYWNLNYTLKGHGIYPHYRKGEYYYNEDDKLMGKVTLQSGYYSGVQVIVETDPEELFDYYDDETLEEEYAPDHEPLLEAVKSMTDHYEVLAQFSNGETIYSKVDA